MAALNLNHLVVWALASSHTLALWRDDSRSNASHNFLGYAEFSQAMTGGRRPVDPSAYGFCKNTRHCCIQGDPHVMTYDDGHFSYQGKGEFLLSQSSSATGSHTLTGCFASFNTHIVSYTTKLAFMCSDEHIAFADAKFPGVVKLYKKTGPGTWALSTDWHTVSLSHRPGVRANIKIIECPTSTHRALGVSLVVTWRSVSEHKNQGNQIQVMNAQVHSDVSAVYGTMAGLCNSYPAESPNSFKGAGGSLIPFPDLDDKASKAAFEANPLGPESWRVNGQPTSLFDKIGKTCTAANGHGNSLAQESDADFVSSYDFAACLGDQAAINASLACITQCETLHGLNTPAKENCIFDILAECDGNCADVFSEDP